MSLMGIFEYWFKDSGLLHLDERIMYSTKISTVNFKCQWTTYGHKQVELEDSKNSGLMIL